VIGAQGHFVLASWLLAGALIAFTVALVASVVFSFLEGRRESVGVIEAVFALRRAGAIDADEAFTILQRYESEAA
jgi:cell division protein FtsX